MNASNAPDWRRLLWRRLRVVLVLALLLTVAGGLVYYLAPQWIVQASQWREAGRAGLENRQIDVEGQRWAYYEGGSGPTIVLLHGLGGSRNDWVAAARHLTGNFHVLIPDLPGSGDSWPVADGQAGPRAQVARLAAFVQRLGVPKMVLFGHGSGGLVAGLYAHKHPSRVMALGFVDSAGVGHWSDASGQGVLTYRDRAGFRHLLELAFAEPPEVPARLADVFVERNLQRMDWLRRSVNKLRGPDQVRGLEGLLADLQQPVMVMWCREDRMIDVAAVGVFRSGLKASSRIDVTTLFGCSHMPMREQPEAAARAITRFMLPVPARQFGSATAVDSPPADG